MSNHNNFVFVGGNISIDFSNTIKMVNGVKTDLLTSPLALYKWTKHFEFNIPFTSIEENFQKLITLRDLIHNCYQDFAYKRKIATEHLRNFNEFIQISEIFPQLITGVSNFPKLFYESNQLNSPLLHQIIQSFFDVIGDEKTLSRLKPCENDECVLLFIDKSKNQSRRWCSMTICGNKIKASNFYYRHR
ncbi:putative RNA-binding Zn ribbon-like protein [Anoxybacillus tepidamans]|uniref:Putative RNA-binding Zn ribbon-like protein n=1 Tax=Anoxybacteroides tepidamans TaxID=265948 RepID=A0A7W8ITH7_9BACL|nr:CGNR zinc finger domain-containing protein [Anoxybacillus tepidamans]MBB5326376.1 putative RNA-binding Zn ribbon-like protein [Anoxybacillus tepidamans]